MSIRADEKLPPKYYWQQLPDKFLFLMVLIPWILLFQFWGNSTFGYLKTPSMFGWMKYIITNSVDDQHCGLMPFVVLILLWWKRDELVAAPKANWWPGLAIVGLSAFLHIGGFMVQQIRVSIVAFFIGLYGLTGVIWGPQWLKRTFFPMFLFAFCVPFAGVADGLTLPLRIIVTKISVGIAHGLLGLDYVRVGSQIFDGQGTPLYDVAPACSGIRSLISLLALTTIYGFISFTANWKKGLMIAVAVPLAIVGNVVRVTTVLLVDSAFGQKAGVFIETKFGFLTFAVAIGAVMVLGYFLREPKPESTKTLDAIPA